MKLTIKQLHHLIKEEIELAIEEDYVGKKSKKVQTKQDKPTQDFDSLQPDLEEIIQKIIDSNPNATEEDILNFLKDKITKNVTQRRNIN